MKKAGYAIHEKKIRIKRVGKSLFNTVVYSVIRFIAPPATCTKTRKDTPETNSRLPHVVVSHIDSPCSET